MRTLTLLALIVLATPAARAADAPAPRESAPQSAPATPAAAPCECGGPGKCCGGQAAAVTATAPATPPASGCACGMKQRGEKSAK